MNKTNDNHFLHLTLFENNGAVIKVPHVGTFPALPFSTYSRRNRAISKSLYCKHWINIISFIGKQNYPESNSMQSSICRFYIRHWLTHLQIHRQQSRKQQQQQCFHNSQSWPAANQNPAFWTAANHVDKPWPSNTSCCPGRTIQQSYSVVNILLVMFTVKADVSWGRVIGTDSFQEQPKLNRHPENFQMSDCNSKVQLICVTNNTSVYYL